MPPRRRFAQHVFSVAVGLLGLGVVAAFNIQVGYSQPGTPLYQPDAQVNIDAGAIGQKVFRRQSLGDVFNPALPAYPVGAGSQRAAAGGPSAGLLTE